MSKVSIISRARISENGNYVTVNQDTRAYAPDNKTLRDVSDGLARTSDGTAELAYDIYKKKR
ncbi:MAG: hypothetical protein KJ906_03740 [Nanoarchaeota archaeon]|nr:hypothetical protein [Nanoarchaeota archaeon]